MLISQRCQYAVRAVFELAKQYGQGPVKIDVVAASQAIPSRFLAAILNQLKQAGFVESRRGSEGGYLLARSPASITVGQIIRHVEGPVGPVECVIGGIADRCPLRGSCVFESMWEEAKLAVENVYDKTTFKDLIDREASATGHKTSCPLTYTI